MNTPKLPKIIGLTGKKGSGKDTLANYLIKKYNYTRLAFADPLKDSCKIIFGLTNEQVHGNKKEEIDPYWNITPRKILQFVGTELYREKIGELLPNVGKNIWVNVIDRKLQENLENKYVITDIRFQNELDLVKKYNGKIIKINREKNQKQEYIRSANAVQQEHVPVEYDQHVSENYIDDLKSDYIIYNNSSIPELYELFEQNFKNYSR